MTEMFPCLTAFTIDHTVNVHVSEEQRYSRMYFGEAVAFKVACRNFIVVDVC
jgi:hypothetical protein